MAREQDLQEIKARIENANTLGRSNLLKKGVKAPEGTSTHGIMEKIADISIGVNYLQYAKTFNGIFSGATFSENTILHIKNDIAHTGAKEFSNAFSYASNLKKVVIEGSTNSVALILSSMLLSCTSIEVFDVSKCSAFVVSKSANAFRGCTNLTHILGEFDFTPAILISDMFRDCTNLIEFRVKEETLNLSIDLGQSPNLSTETRQSLVAGLKTLTYQQTLTLHKNVFDALTEEEKTIIENKNWLVVSAE